MTGQINSIYQIIEYFEGFSATIYRCAGGYKTIGYGHVVKAGEQFDVPISHAQARKLLAQDVASIRSGVDRLIHVPLMQFQYDALISFAYNLGCGALQRSTLRQKVNRAEFEHAAAEFNRWVYAGGRKLKGLILRRHIEAALFSGNAIIIKEGNGIYVGS